MNLELLDRFAPERRKEWELLLISVREAVTGIRDIRVESLIRGDLDWAYITGIATRHRIHFFLYKTICDYEEYLSGNSHFISLKKQWKSYATRAVQLFAKLIGLIGLFRSEGIQAVPFKGAMLSDLAYGDFTLREFGDIDILVDLHEAYRAIRLLEAELIKPEFKLSKNQFRAYSKHKNSLPFICRSTGLAVDLHWEISPKYITPHLTFDVFEPHLLRASIENKPFDLLSLEDTILYQCIHIASHNWHSLESVSSVAGIIVRHPDIDWQLLLELAEKHRCERILLITLCLARDLCKIQLIDGLESRIEKDSKVSKLSSKILQQMVIGNKSGNKRVYNNKFRILHFKVRRGFREKLRYATYLLLSPTLGDWERFPLEAKFTFLHPILRPMRLFLKYLRYIRV